MNDTRDRERVDELGAVVWEADADARVCTFVNGRGAALVGQDASAWRRPGFLLEVTHPADRRGLASTVRRAADGEPGQVRCRLRAASGAWRSFIAAVERIDPIAVDMASGASVRGVMIDVTALHDAEGTLSRAETQLVQEDTAESFAGVAGTVAHDVNNVLGAIVVFARLLERRSSDPETVLRHAAGIRAAGERGADLVNQLRQLGRRRAPPAELLDVGEAVEGMRALLARLAQDKVDVQVNVRRPFARVSVPPGALERILLHLVTNARDAMPNGGTITVDVGAVHVACTLPGELPAGEWVVLAVSDDGTGMDAATRQRVFEPFFTTKPEGAGSGLGLSSLHALVSRVRGCVLVSSTPGKGSVFRICLPAATVALPSRA
jgi:signal transduction histidine kinase